MRLFYLLVFTFFIICSINYSIAKNASPGEVLFFNIKGKYGSCNHCHRNGESAGRWNFETQEIDKEEGKKIPILKGIGKRKDPEQIERSIELMKKLFGFKLTKEQMSQLVEYLGTL